MRPFRTILFAADFSENSMEAFRMAGSLAVDDKTRLFVVHVSGPDQAAEGPARITGREALEKRLGETYVPNHPVDVTCVVREGDISAGILGIAREIGADLIVMGTQGRTGLRRLIAGSVATAVLREAPCPVLALSSRAGDRTRGPVRVILHPTDFSPSSEGALRVARALAGDLGARLFLLHVLPLAILMDGSMAAEVDPQPYRDSLRNLAEALDGPDLKQPIETLLVHGFDREEICRVAEQTACDLIVMGTHGRSGVGRLVLGSVAEAVLPRVDCPVLVVKTPERVTSEKPSGPKTVTVF
jgi:nucleotide-binding universal stress UspA family protein